MLPCVFIEWRPDGLADRTEELSEQILMYPTFDDYRDSPFGATLWPNVAVTCSRRECGLSQVHRIVRLDCVVSLTSSSVLS